MGFPLAEPASPHRAAGSWNALGWRGPQRPPGSDPVPWVGTPPSRSLVKLHVGFVLSSQPDFSKWSSSWWDNLWLLPSLRFLSTQVDLAFLIHLFNFNLLCSALGWCLFLTVWGPLETFVSIHNYWVLNHKRLPLGPRGTADTICHVNSHSLHGYVFSYRKWPCQNYSQGTNSIKAASPASKTNSTGEAMLWVKWLETGFFSTLL